MKNVYDDGLLLLVLLLLNLSRPSVCLARASSDEQTDEQHRSNQLIELLPYRDTYRHLLKSTILALSSHHHHHHPSNQQHHRNLNVYASDLGSPCGSDTDALFADTSNSLLAASNAKDDAGDALVDRIDLFLDGCQAIEECSLSEDASVLACSFDFGILYEFTTFRNVCLDDEDDDGVGAHFFTLDVTVDCDFEFPGSSLRFLVSTKNVSEVRKMNESSIFCWQKVLLCESSQETLPSYIYSYHYLLRCHCFSVLPHPARRSKWMIT